MVLLPKSDDVEKLKQHLVNSLGEFRKDNE
jgi:hypothetical protein